MRRASLTALIAGATLAACSATPQHVDELDEARAAVQQVQALPAANQYAAQELAAANQALSEAERLARDKKSAADIRLMAYLAKRQADIAVEHIAAAQAKEAIEKANAERERILLKLRSEQAAEARNP